MLVHQRVYQFISVVPCGTPQIIQEDFTIETPWNNHLHMDVMMDVMIISEARSSHDFQVIPMAQGVF